MNDEVINKAVHEAMGRCWHATPTHRDTPDAYSRPSSPQS